MPIVSKLDAEKNYDNLGNMYLQYSKITSFLVFPLCSGFIILGGDFIAIWMGEKYRIVAGNILTILTISYLFYLVQKAVAYPILMGTSRLRFPTIFMAVTSILNLLLSIWWGTAYGVYGVAWGTTVPNLLNTMGIVWYTCITFKVPIYSYFYRAILLPMSAATFFIVPAVIFRRYIAINSYLDFFLCVT